MAFAIPEDFRQEISLSRLVPAATRVWLKQPPSLLPPTFPLLQNLGIKDFEEREGSRDGGGKGSGEGGGGDRGERSGVEYTRQGMRKKGSSIEKGNGGRDEGSGKRGGA